MARNTHLQKRGSVYYFRYRVPADIVDVFGKAEIKVSLGTKDLREAKTRLSLKLIETEREFEEARGRTFDGISNPTSSSLPPIPSIPTPQEHYDRVRFSNDTYREHVYSKVENDLPGFLRGDHITLPRNEWYYRLSEEGDWENILSYCFRFEVKTRIKALKRARIVGDFSEHKSLANNDLKSGLTLLEAEVKALEDILKRYKGSDPEPHVPEISSTTVSPVSSANSAPLLSHASREWFSEKSKGVSEKTADGYQARIREFISIIGDKPINQYTKAHVRDFKAILEKLPPNWSKQHALNGLTARQVAKQTTHSTKTLSPTTIKDILVICGRCFTWFVVNRDDIDINPFTGIKVEGKPDARNERNPFSTNDLKQIFMSSRFAAFNRISAMYWVPIIGLFTGMRLGEICQLYTSDVRSGDNGVTYFDNNTDQTDKKLKSYTARRQIPIHQVLIDLGFLEFVDEKTPTDSDARLFPEILVGTDGHYSSRFGQKFSRFLNLIGVKREKISFHSFRHNFEDAARAAQIDHPIMSALQGHVMGDMSDRYGSGYTLRVLNEALQKIQYEEITANLLQK